MAMSNKQPVVVIPNFNGGAALLEAVESLYKQTRAAQIIVVDNNSSDGSLQKMESEYPDVVYQR